MSEEMSHTRLRLLRAMYLGNLVLLGAGVWPELIGLHRAWEPLPAVAFCFWAALGALSALGLRHPIAMLPLLLLQLLYKTIWIIAVWLPLQVTGAAADMSVGRLNLAVMFIGGAVADLVVIPWPHVVALFTRADGDHWSDPTQSAERSGGSTGSRPASALSSGAKQPVET